MHSNHNGNASANTTKSPGSASLASALAVAASSSTAAARKGGPMSSRAAGSSRSSPSPGRGASAMAKQQQQQQQQQSQPPLSGASSAVEVQSGAAGPAPFLHSTGLFPVHSHLQPHGHAAKLGASVRAASPGAGGALGEGPGAPHATQHLPHSIMDVFMLEGMQHDLRRLQLVLDFGPEAGIALGPLSDSIILSSSIEIDTGASHAVPPKPPKPGPAAANARGKGKNATKDKGDAGAILSAADSGGVSSRPESAWSGGTLSSNSSGASKKEFDKLGAEIEGILAQAAEVALAENGRQGSQPLQSNSDQSAAIRAALLQLFCCRTGHLLSVLCTTLGGYAGTFNDTSWARDAAASCGHAPKEGSLCATGAVSRQHPAFLTNGHSNSNGVSNGQNNHLPHVQQPEHPSGGSGQQAWHTTLRGRPNSAMPKACGGNNGNKLRANSAHSGTPSAHGMAANATGTLGVTSGPTQGMGAGGPLANGVKGLSHKAAHPRSLGPVSMYPMLQAVSDVADCLGQFKSTRKERDEMMLEIQNLRRQLLSMNQDNTLLRNHIADSHLDLPKVQPRCSACSKSLNSSHPPPPPGPDGTLLLTLNMQLQQQLHQAQLQLQQQQKKAKDQLEQHHLLAQTELRSSLQQLSVAEDMLEAARKDVEAQKKRAEALQQQAEELQAQVTPHQEQLWSVQRIERQQAAQARQKLEAELKEVITQKIRVEAEMRVAKMEVFELKSAESVRSNTAHREDSAMDELAAENKALTAEISKLRYQHNTLQHAIKAAEQRADKAGATSKTAEHRADKASEAIKAAEQRADKAAAALKAAEQRADKAAAGVKAAEQRAERAAADASQAAAKGATETSEEKLIKALAEAKAGEQKTAAALKAAEQHASQAEAAAKVADFRITKGVKAVEALEQENRKLEAALLAAQQKAEGTTSLAEDERKRLAAAEKQVASLTSQLLHAQSQLDASMRATAEAEARCTEAGSSKAANAKIAGLEWQLKAAKEEASKASKAKIAGLEAQLAKAKETLREARGVGGREAGDVNKVLAEAQEQLGVQAGMVARLEVEVKELTRQLKDSQESGAVRELSGLETRLKEVQERAAKAEVGQARTAKAEAALERAEADAERARKELYKIKAEAESKEEQLVQEKEQLESLRVALEAEIASVRAMGTLSQAKTMRFDINTLNNAAVTAASSRPSTARSSDSSGGAGPALLPPSIPGAAGARPVSGHDQASHARLGHMVRELQSQLSTERARAAQAASEAEALQRQLERAAASQGAPIAPTASAERHGFTMAGSKQMGQGQLEEQGQGTLMARGLEGMSGGQQKEQQQQQQRLQQKEQELRVQQSKLEQQQQKLAQQKQQVVDNQEEQHQQQQAGQQVVDLPQRQQQQQQEELHQQRRAGLQVDRQQPQRAERLQQQLEQQQQQLQAQRTELQRVRQEAEAAAGRAASKQKQLQEELSRSLGEKQQAEAARDALTSKLEDAEGTILAQSSQLTHLTGKLKAAEAQVAAHRGYAESARAEVQAMLAAYQAGKAAGDKHQQPHESLEPTDWSLRPTATAATSPPSSGQNSPLRNLASNSIRSRPFSAQPAPLERPPALHTPVSLPASLSTSTLSAAAQHHDPVPATPLTAWVHTAAPVAQKAPSPLSNSNGTAQAHTAAPVAQTAPNPLSNSDGVPGHPPNSMPLSAHDHAPHSTTPAAPAAAARGTFSPTAPLTANTATRAAAAAAAATAGAAGSMPLPNPNVRAHTYPAAPPPPPPAAAAAGSMPLRNPHLPAHTYPAAAPPAASASGSMPLPNPHLPAHTYPAAPPPPPPPSAAAAARSMPFPDPRLPAHTAPAAALPAAQGTPHHTQHIPGHITSEDMEAPTAAAHGAPFPTTHPPTHTPSAARAAAAGAAAAAAAARDAHSPPLDTHTMAVQMESRPALLQQRPSEGAPFGTPFMGHQQQQEVDEAEVPQGDEEEAEQHMELHGTQSERLEETHSEQPRGLQGTGGEVGMAGTRGGGGGVYGMLSRGLAGTQHGNSSSSSSWSTGTAAGGPSASSGSAQQQQQQQQQHTLLRPRPSSALRSNLSNSSMKGNSSAVAAAGQPGGGVGGSPLSRPSSARAFQSRVSFHSSTREPPLSSLLGASREDLQSSLLRGNRERPQSSSLTVGSPTRPSASARSPGVPPQFEGQAQPQPPPSLSAPNTPTAMRTPLQAPQSSAGGFSEVPVAEGPFLVAHTSSHPSSAPSGLTSPSPQKVTPAAAPLRAAPSAAPSAALPAAAAAAQAASRLAPEGPAPASSRKPKPRPLTIEHSFGSASGGGSLPGSPAAPPPAAAVASRVLSPQFSRSFVREPSPGSPPAIILPSRPGSARITTLGYRIPPSPSRRLRTSSNSGLSSPAASKHTSRSVSRSSLAPSHPQNSNSAADDQQQEEDDAGFEEDVHTASPRVEWVQQAWDEGPLLGQSSTGREGAAAAEDAADVAPVVSGQPSEMRPRFQPHPPSPAAAAGGGAGGNARHLNPRSYFPRRPGQAALAGAAERGI